MEQFTLIQLQKLIKAGIESQHESAYWVIAEINELKINSAGHCYIELVQKNEKNDFLEAKISAIIWAGMFNLLQSYFETSTGKKLDAGIKVLVKTYVQYHELYGLSLNITDIDPSYTIGNIELQRQKTIQKLQSEGIFDMNRELDFPLIPQRIAIVSSKQAAGYQDFIQQLTNNEYNYKFHTQLYTATLQGKDAEQSIINALDTIYNQYSNFDVVVIIRGGGSQADLSYFDSYRLAYHVAQFPLPILTGIGHDKDISITDMVAFKMLKTPTAVAAFLTNCLLEQESGLLKLAEKVETILSTKIFTETNRLNIYLSQLQTLVRNNINKQQILLSNWLPKQISTASKHIVNNQKQHISKLSAQIEANNPYNILNRGYSLTFQNGKIIKSINDIKINNDIETLLVDGKFTSHIKPQDN